MKSHEVMSASLDHCEGQRRYGRQSSEGTVPGALRRCQMWLLGVERPFVSYLFYLVCWSKIPIREEAFMLAGGCNQGGCVPPWCLSWTERCQWIPFACGTC